MGKFSIDNPPIRVLMLDVHATGFTLAQFPWEVHNGFFNSIGAHVEWRHAPSIPADSQVYSDHWDLIVIPWIGDATSQYSNFKVQLALFADTDIPVWYAQSFLAHGASAQPTTGITAANTTGKFTSGGLENWQSRKSGQVTFYGDAPTIAGASSVTIHARDAANDAVMLWSNTVENHPALFMTAHASQSSTLAKPWLGAQWMIDQCPDATRKQQLKSKIKKRFCLMRWDMLGSTNDGITHAAGFLDTAYDILKIFGVKEIWLAALWTNLSTDVTITEVDDTSPGATAWFLARDQSNGGLFRCMNHQTDIVNGTEYTPDERCTTDNVNPDGFKNADNAYRVHCDKLTAYGFTLGSDSYGKGIPNVQNGNDMNNPSAHFLSGKNGIYDTDGVYGGFGVDGIWLSGDEDYPTGLTPQASIRNSIIWGDGRTLLSYSEDTMTSTHITNMAVTWNADIVRSFINGGGIYYHGGTANFFLHDHAEEFGQLFTSCPDVLASGPWEDMLESLNEQNGIWFDA